MKETIGEVALLVAFFLLGFWIGLLIGFAGYPANCGATDPLVAVMREQEVNATCTVTGVIMDARIELVEGE